MSRPTAQPVNTETVKPATVTPPLMMSPRPTENKTMRQMIGHRGRDIMRETVTSAARPPRSTLNGVGEFR